VVELDDAWTIQARRNGRSSELLRYGSGWEPAITDLYTIYYRRMVAAITAQVQDLPLAEDVVQNAFIEVNNR
jgi:DNA-directed RNA polymerase specialized sigma24 family protein